MVDLEAKMPAYPAEWLAWYNMPAPDEYGYFPPGFVYWDGTPASYLQEITYSQGSKGKMQWRIGHCPSPTGYLKVWLVNVARDESYIETRTPLPPYEWRGVGNPCLTDPTISANAPANFVASPDEFEVLPPEHTGTNEIRIEKYSLLEDYEPDITDPENPQPNGFPAPTWTA
jgi:hypothetical protein